MIEINFLAKEQPGFVSAPYQLTDFSPPLTADELDDLRYDTLWGELILQIGENYVSYSPGEFDELAKSACQTVENLLGGTMLLDMAIFLAEQLQTMPQDRMRLSHSEADGCVMDAVLSGDLAILSTQNFPRDVYNVKIPEKDFFFAIRFFLRRIYDRVITENAQLTDLALIRLLER